MIDTQVVKKILQSVIYTTTTNTTTVNTDNTTTTTTSITSRDPLTNPTLNLTGDQFPIYIHHYNCPSLYVWKKVFGELGIVCTHKSLNCLIERWKKSKPIKKNFQQILSSTLYISVNNTTLIVYRNSKSVTPPVSPTAPQLIPSTISSLPSIKDLPSISSLPPLSALPSLSTIS